MKDGSKLYTTPHMCRKNKYHPLCCLNDTPPTLALKPPVPVMAKIAGGQGNFILTIQHSSDLSNYSVVLHFTLFSCVLQLVLLTMAESFRENPAHPIGRQRSTCSFCSWWLAWASLSVHR